MSLTGEHPRGSGNFARLARMGFVHVERADLLLTQLGLSQESAGGPNPPNGITGAMVAELANAADPDLALLTLSRIAERAADWAELLAALRARAGFRARLVAVLGTSAALGHHLVTHPGECWTLADDVVSASRPSSYGLRQSLGDCSRVSALQTSYRRFLLGLAARDLSGALAVDDVAAELADLAAATLDAALRLARSELPPDAPAVRLAVIGMGKCGGRELNYVSDVDVVFVAEPGRLEGSAEPAPERAHPGVQRRGWPGGSDDADTGHETALAAAERLAAGLMRICGEVAWPVDAALRPEGKAGRLVRTLASHEAYYRRWARTWEFQALLKARPVAGDLALGRRYVDMISPLVWTAAERPGFVDDVQQMRRRVEQTLPARNADREVKLGPGGLRDVEFAVQLLQLVHGRADETLRSPSTLPALAALAAGGYVGREDARKLAESYRWLRTVEHRLQLARLRRTHTVPTGPADLRWLARSLGYRPGPHGDAVSSFDYERTRYAREVRRLHEKLFYRPLLHAVARVPTEVARLSPGAAEQRLRALGFADPAGALRHLEALSSGVSRRAAIQHALLPAMLGAFADAADPDAGLLAYRQVSDALGATPWYLRLLRDEGVVAERLARLLASSRYVADLIARAPRAIAMLADTAALTPRSRRQLEDELLAVVGRQDDWADAAGAARGVRRQELLRIACGDLLGLREVGEVGAALSDAAAATISAALQTATAKVAAEYDGQVPIRFAVIAMGRLGGREQGYGSDADVLFVHEGHEGVSDTQAAVAGHVLAEEMRQLLALPAPDPPLLVDAGLRPEGRQGPLSRSLAGYQAYYQRWSSVWEAQALLRADLVAGDVDLGQRFITAIDPVRWPADGLVPEQEVEIRRIKARIEAERLPRGAERSTHTKLGPGGLADVEWTVQLLQLRHAAHLPALRTTGTLTALAAEMDAGLVAAADAEMLRAAWTLATRTRNAIMLVRGRPADGVPTTGRTLAGVARALGYSAGAAGEFLEDYQRATRRARTVVERVFYR